MSTGGIDTEMSERPCPSDPSPLFLLKRHLLARVSLATGRSGFTMEGVRHFTVSINREAQHCLADGQLRAREA